MSIALWCCLLVSAGPNGDEILRKVDDQLGKAKSQIMTMEMVIEDKGHEPRRIGLQMYMRGEQRRISFLYPGDMKGMRVLNLANAQTYVYLPAFRKVRRVASHMRDQTMFGSDFAPEDLATLSLTQSYQGNLTAESDDSWSVRAKPKTGVESPYAYVDITISKKLAVPTQLKYFDDAGKNLRTETREDFQCSDAVCSPRRTRMVDHRHDDHWTEVTIKELQLNKDFSDQIFSLRDLQRND